MEALCAECLSESPGDQSEPELRSDGWDLDGEFGHRCPECVGKNARPSAQPGLDGVAEALGASKKETT